MFKQFAPANDNVDYQKFQNMAIVRGWNLAIKRDNGLHEAARVIWYTGKSKDAAHLYCVVRLWGKDGRFAIGSGYAGGYGYDKYSASFVEALANAVIILMKDISGAGQGCIRVALCQIAREMGDQFNDNDGDLSGSDHIFTSSN